MKPTRATNLIDRLLGIAGDSPRDLAVIEQRLAVLQPRMPWLNAKMLSCQVGMTFTFDAERDPPLVVIVVAMLTALRGVKWRRMRRETLVGEAARKRVRAIGIASLVTSVIFMVVIAQFFPNIPPAKRQSMMVMTATCTIALAMPMSALPSSARLTYILFGIPGALVGTFAGDERAPAVASFNARACSRASSTSPTRSGRRALPSMSRPPPTSNISARSGAPTGRAISSADQ